MVGRQYDEISQMIVIKVLSDISNTTYKLQKIKYTLWTLFEVLEEFLGGFESFWSSSKSWKYWYFPVFSNFQSSKSRLAIAFRDQSFWELKELVSKVSAEKDSAESVHYWRRYDFLKFVRGIADIARNLDHNHLRRKMPRPTIPILSVHGGEMVT